MKISVNQLNSKHHNNELYITMLKCQQMKHKLIQDFIDYGTVIQHPVMGKMVRYTGDYNRSIKR